MVPVGLLSTLTCLGAMPSLLVVICREHAEQVERRGEARLAKLDSELNGCKTNLVQESIRMGHNAIGEHCYERGDLQVGTGVETKVAVPVVKGITYLGRLRHRDM